MICVLDACAMIAFLRGEPGSHIVQAILKDGTKQCFAHALNLCEVYYDFLKASDKITADRAINDLLSIGIINRGDVDEAFWKEAGEYKANIKKISLADCFALTLTLKFSGELVTSDRKEFGPIAKKGICSIKFIR